MLVSDEVIKLGYTDGEVLGSTIKYLNWIVFRIYEVTWMSPLVDFYDVSNHSKLGG